MPGFGFVPLRKLNRLLVCAPTFLRCIQFLQKSDRGLVAVPQQRLPRRRRVGLSFGREFQDDVLYDLGSADPAISASWRDREPCNNIRLERIMVAVKSGVPDLDQIETIADPPGRAGEDSLFDFGTLPNFLWRERWIFWMWFHPLSLGKRGR